MKTYLVQLDPHDDLISARDKISWSKARRVLLVWPRTGRVLDRKVDLLVLLRHCHSLGAQMAIVAGRGDVRANAHELGIPIFRSAAQAQQRAWRTPAQAFDERWSKARGDRRGRDLRAERDGYHARPALKTWARFALFTLGLAACLALVAFFAPSAQISLALRQRPQALLVSGWADPDLAASNLSGGVPAREITVTVEGRQDAAVTGSVLVADAYAVGSVQVTNTTDTALDLPAGSVVLSAGSPVVRFLTTRGAGVAAGATVIIPIQAELPGRGGNLPAGSIRALEGTAGFDVQINNVEPTGSGGEQTAPAPAEVDFDRLRSSLLEALRQNALEELRTQAGTERRVLENSIHLAKIIEERSDPGVGLPSDRLRLTMRVEFAALTVAEADWDNVARSALDASLPDGWQPVDGSLRWELVEGAGEASATPGQKAAWQLKALRALEPRWNAGGAADLIRGMSIREASQTLQAHLPIDQPPVIEVFPMWWGRMPVLSFRMEFVAQ